MTLVLSYSRPDPPVSIQVSDRLLTDSTTQNPLDPRANKAVVFSTRGALVVFGYSGRAAVNFGRASEKTSDHWIAEQLSASKLDVAPCAMGTNAYQWDLGLALRSLRTALGADTQFAEQGTEINFCGVQWRRGRMNRGLFSASGSLATAGGGYELSHIRSRAEGGAPHVLRVIGGELPDANVLLDSLARSDGPETAEQLLIDAVRDAAVRSPLIGSDCLVVRISPEGVRVRYDGRRPVIGPDELPGTPLPWIVTPGTVCGPMVSRTPGLRISGIPIQVEVPPGEPRAEVLGPGKTPGSVRKRYIVPGFTVYSSRYGVQPPEVPPPSVDTPRVRP